MSIGEERGPEPNLGPRPGGATGTTSVSLRRILLPAVALVLALTAVLSLWQTRSETPRLGQEGAVPVGGPVNTGGADEGRDDSSLPPPQDDESTIGEAFSHGIATATPVPLLARTALLPLVVAADAAALGRALDRRQALEGSAPEAGTPAVPATAAAWPAPLPTAETSSPPGGVGTSGDGMQRDAGAQDPARAAALADLPPDTPAWQRALLAERVGYGRLATGGLGGRIVHVTTNDDEGDGSIRAALEGPGPRWVVFDVSGIIRLGEMLRVPPNTTIDGRGTYVAFQGRGLDIRDVENVIVSHVVLEGGEGDAISVRARASKVWLHHLTLRDFSDGLIDVTREATDVTVSWCRFEDHEKVMLVGGDEKLTGDAVIRLTMHHNLFDRTGQRQPRLRFGRVHAFNNVLDRWRSIGMAVNQGGQLLVERNVFLAGEDAEEAVRAGADEDAPGRVRAGDNLLQERDETGGWRVATAEERAQRIETRHPERVFDPAIDYAYVAEPADEALLARVRSEAGWQPEAALEVGHPASSR